MNTTAWKFLEKDGEVVYSIQFEDVPWKFKKALQEAMKDWRQVSFGWYKNNNNQLFVFRKAFKSLEEWTEWASKFPMQIKEKRVWGDKEKIILHGKNRVKNAK